MFPHLHGRPQLCSRASAFQTGPNVWTKFSSDFPFDLNLNDDFDIKMFYTQRDYKGFPPTYPPMWTYGHIFSHSVYAKLYRFWKLFRPIIVNTSTISLLALAYGRISSESRRSNKDTTPIVEAVACTMALCCHFDLLHANVNFECRMKKKTHYII